MRAWTPRADWRWASTSAERRKACSTRSTRALSENGFSQKSKAPRLTASTAVGTSPWPVRNSTGIARCRPRSTRLSNSARPLMPGMRTSSSRQQGWSNMRPAVSPPPRSIWSKASAPS